MDERPKPERRIPENTAEFARWLAESIAHRREARFGGATCLFLSMALEGYAAALERGEADTFKHIVRTHTPGREHEVIAASSSAVVATAAYQAAIAARPGDRIVYANGSRVTLEHIPEPGEVPKLTPIAFTPREKPDGRH